MTGTDQFGLERRTPYAFAGAAVELGRAVPLADQERVLLHGVARRRAAGRLPRPVLVRLSPPRLVALTHYAFAHDRVLEVPRAAVCDIAVHGDVVQIGWRRSAEVTAVLRLGPWSGPDRFDRPLPAADELAALLTAWLRTG